MNTRWDSQRTGTGMKAHRTMISIPLAILLASSLVSCQAPIDSLGTYNGGSAGSASPSPAPPAPSSDGSSQAPGDSPASGNSSPLPDRSSPSPGRAPVPSPAEPNPSQGQPNPSPGERAPSPDEPAPSEGEPDPSVGEPDPPAGEPDPSEGEPAPSPVTPEQPTDLPDFSLFSLGECGLVPEGALSGADALGIFVAIRNSGPGVWANLVPYALVSDTGLRGEGNSSVSLGSSFAHMQVEVGDEDYKKVHRFVVTADPNNEIPELDETNNTLVVRVELPPAPKSAVEVSCVVE